MKEHQHNNPDGSVVIISIGEGASIGAGARIGAGAIIGEGASIGAKARIGARVRIGAGAIIGAEARIESGDSLHLFTGKYYVDGYRNKDGIPVLRHGCETLLLTEWTAENQSKLCAIHNRDAAPSLARAVRTVAAFFA